MRGVSFLVGIAATAFMASTAQSASAQTASPESASPQSASTTSLVKECERIAPPHYTCVLGRVVDDHTLLVLATSQDLPTDRPAIWASKASETYRRLAALERYRGRLVMVSGDWTNGALFYGRLLMVPTYTHRQSP